MRALTIDRRKWARGARGGSSALLNDIGGMCCLGFEARACGFTKKSLFEAGTPMDITLNDSRAHTKRKAVTKAPHLLKLIEESPGDDPFVYLKDTTFVNRAVRINDTNRITERTRETRLQALFAKQDINLQFIN